MNEKTLTKVSFACSIIGITALFLLSESIEIDERAIGIIDISMIGNDVAVEGIVKSVINSEKVSIIKVTGRGNNEIAIIAFKKNEDDNVELRNNDKIRVIGKIDEYNGRPEIIASEIRITANEKEAD